MPMEDLSVGPNNPIYYHRLEERRRREWDRGSRGGRLRKSPLIDRDIVVLSKPHKFGYVTRVKIPMAPYNVDESSDDEVLSLRKLFEEVENNPDFHLSVAPYNVDDAENRRDFYDDEILSLRGLFEEAENNADYHLAVAPYNFDDAEKRREFSDDEVLSLRELFEEEANNADFRPALEIEADSTPHSHLYMEDKSMLQDAANEDDTHAAADENIGVECPNKDVNAVMEPPEDYGDLEDLPDFSHIDLEDTILLPGHS